MSTDSTCMQICYRGKLLLLCRDIVWFQKISIPQLPHSEGEGG